MLNLPTSLPSRQCARICFKICTAECSADGDLPSRRRNFRLNFLTLTRVRVRLREGGKETLSNSRMGIIGVVTGGSATADSTLTETSALKIGSDEHDLRSTPQRQRLSRSRDSTPYLTARAAIPCRRSQARCAHNGKAVPQNHGCSIATLDLVNTCAKP